MTTKLACFSLLLGGVFLLSSCSSYRDIEVKDFTIDDFSMQGSNILIDFSAMVHNPGRAFTLQRAEGEFNHGQHPFATAQLMDAISVVGKSERRYSGQMQLTVKDLMALFRMGADSNSWDLNAFLFTGDMRIKSAGIKKTFKYRDTPLNQLLNSL